jgi:hypothetical protein
MDKVIKYQQRFKAYYDTFQDYLTLSNNPLLLPCQWNQIVFSKLMDRLKDIEYQHLNNEEFEKLKDNVIKQAREHPTVKIYSQVRFYSDVRDAMFDLNMYFYYDVSNREFDVSLFLDDYQLNPERQVY